MSVAVLLVESEDEIARAIEAVLVEAGLRVQRARDGAAGVAAFRPGGHDVVIVGGLPQGMSGVDVCKAIRRRPGTATLGIVLMSAAFRGSSAMRDAYREAGVDAFFHKPFVLEELVEGLFALVDHKRAQAAAEEDPLDIVETVDEVEEIEDVTMDVDVPKTMVMPAGTLPGAVPAPAPRFADLGFKTDVYETQDPQIGGPLANHVDVARALLAAARTRATGIVRLQDGGSRMDVAFLKGVVVGGWDNLREHLLGERLWRRGILTADQMRRLNERIASKGERVAEALIALGLCDARTALLHIEEQARDRVRRALAWKGGAVSFEIGVAAVDKLAVASIDLLDEVLQFGLLPVHGALAKRFLVERASQRIWRTPDFEEGVRAYARARPDSPLRAALVHEGASIQQVVAPIVDQGGLDLYGLWLAGVVRTDGDRPEGRSVPRPFAGDEAAASIVDADAVARVSEALLRARGRTFYEMLGVAPETSADDVGRAILDLMNTIGPDALAHARLGPARAAARELWSILDEARYVLLDPERRAAYDEDVLSTRIAARKAHDFRPEQDFLDGQMSLALGDVEAAREAFERAVAAKAGDAEYIAYLGWATILEGREPLKVGIDMLHEALRFNPQAMRPVFFMGLAAQRAGDDATARSWMQEALRRAPDDPDVKAALLALPADPA